MQTEHFDYLVFVGRFQPLHRGHLAVIEAGLQQAARVIVLCGSAERARHARNPWTVAEREAMIRGALNAGERARVLIESLRDFPYDDAAWVREVEDKVRSLIDVSHTDAKREPRIGLIGHSKDHSSYYLKLFPRWGAIDVENFEGIDSTRIREAYFADAHRGAGGAGAYLSTSHARRDLSANVRDMLQAFAATPDYVHLGEEFAFIDAYKKSWSDAPYEPVFVTVDAVVQQADRILMIERRESPGKGLWALPGGFLNPTERLFEACVRELREETGLSLSPGTLKNALRRHHVFDDPLRSARGRTITHAYHMQLDANEALPAIEAGDDAQAVHWVALQSLDPGRMFEDHYFIIQEMLA